jgi:hypothetical protein
MNCNYYLAYKTNYRKTIKTMQKLLYFILPIVIVSCGTRAQNSTSGKFSPGEDLVITKEKLKDKIMGGWAGQTIGVTYGGPY